MYHSLDICQDIAQKMSDLEAIKELSENSFQRNWASASLFEGIPGIVCFYSAMDLAYPTGGWDAVVHEYVKWLAEEFEKKPSGDPSLFGGIAGLCFSVFLASRSGTRYVQLLSKLEQALIDQVETEFLQKAEDYLREDTEIPPEFYTLMNGISGLVAYLLLRKNHPPLFRLLQDSLKTLLKILNRTRLIDSISVAGWYTSPEVTLGKTLSATFPSGCYILNMGFGLPSCLSTLALVMQNGISQPELLSTIQKLGNWIIEVKKSSDLGISWPGTIPIGDPIENDGQLNRDVWWQGIPAMCRSLYLAGRATKNKEWVDFASRGYCSLFSKPEKEWNMMGPSLAYGRAGVLALTWRMAQDTQSPALFKQVNYLEGDLKRFYSPSKLFGFQVVDFSTEKYRWLDSPGLADGAAGIALVLLDLHTQEVSQWDRSFLMN